MQVQNEMKLQIESRSVNEAYARVAVSAFAASLDPTVEELNDIKTAVSEPLLTTLGGDRAGLGFSVMESFCDRIRVRSAVGVGTTVTLQKRIRGRGAHLDT